MLRNSKVIFSGVFVIVLTVLVNVGIYNHYASFLPQQNHLTTMLLLFNLGVGLVGVATYYYKELVNPYSFIGLFIIQWGISFLQISTRQHPYNPFTIGIILISVISLSAGVLLSNRYYFKKRIQLNDSLQLYLYLSLFMAGVLVFFMEVSKVGYLPFVSILQSRNPAAYNDINDSLIPLLHYLVMFHAVLPILGVILYQRGLLRKGTLILLIGISIFITLNYLSRQSLLLIVLSLFLYTNYKKRISFFKVALFSCVIVYLFGLFGTMRSHTTTIEETNKFLKFYSDIDLNTTLLDTYITLYSSLNFETFNHLVSKAFDHSYFGLGIYTFRPLIALTFIDRVGIVSYPDEYDSFSQLGTFMADPFLDFGWIGIVLVNLICGWVCGVVFNSYRQRNGMIAIINWSILAFCLIMLPFANYFDNFMVWFFLLLTNLFAKDDDIRLHSNL
jgi:oligosaccharide repeat unit polymerase